MSWVEAAGLALLRRLEAETAHALALRAVASPLVPAPGPVRAERLATRLAGLKLENPVGLAAGFDKNAIAAGPLSRAGFGWIEMGAATPLAQPGNPRPRVFRLTRDSAVINRFGFNNDGAEAIAKRLARVRAAVPVGLNLGANKDSPDRSRDFARVLEIVRDHVDFATVNVSSPNTERLRDLQGPAALREVLDAVMAVRGTVPVFLKIAPDLAPGDLDSIVEVAEGTGIAAIIATNTTLARDGLHGPHASETGGLSGAPLFQRSTRVLAQLSVRTALPLVGVGGVATAEDAYTKIKAGARAVQLYTGLVYNGLSSARRIATGLDALLARDGHASVASAIGTERDRWAHA